MRCRQPELPEAQRRISALSQVLLPVMVRTYRLQTCQAPVRAAAAMAAPHAPPTGELGRDVLWRRYSLSMSTVNVSTVQLWCNGAHPAAPLPVTLSSCAPGTWCKGYEAVNATWFCSNPCAHTCEPQAD